MCLGVSAAARGGAGWVRCGPAAVRVGLDVCLAVVREGLGWAGAAARVGLGGPCRKGVC